MVGDAPDWLCIPMGNAGNISAYWMGFQAAGAAPLVSGTTVEEPKTITTR